MESPHRSIELDSPLSQTNQTPSEIEQQPLPPTDTGKGAWLVLAGCTLIQAPVWGYTQAFGVFQEYYSRHPEALHGDGSSAQNVAVVGTTVGGILYLASPFTFAIMTRWPRLRRWFGPIGLAMTFVGFLLSSFSTRIWQLVVTQGVISGLGCGLLFTPTTLYMDEWWVKRKGLALGIMWAGKNVTGITMPFIMDASLRRFGPARTLQGWSVATVVLAGPLLYFLKPRIPLSRTSAVRRISLSFFRLPAFWMLSVGNILQSLGYFLPFTYLSSYAVQEVGASTTIATTMLALVNVTSIPGGIFIGSFGDHFNVGTTVLVSSVGSALAVFCFWGFSSQVALLAVFAITYGFFAGGFSSTWSGVLTELKAQSPALDTGLMFGLLAGGRGIGNVISGPLSVALLTRNDWMKDGKHWGYNGEYGGIILFTGATSLLGGWGWLSWMCRSRQSA
jgi:MFS family permease